MDDTQTHVQLLGELAVFRNGNLVPLPPSKKTRALLAYLLLKGGKHRRDHLCDIFWKVPDDPRASLRWSLSKLRALVDDDQCKRLVADKEHVSIDCSALGVDYLDIKSLISPGLEEMDVDELEKLAERFAGPLLQNGNLRDQPEYENWRTIMQEEARGYLCSCLEALIAACSEDAERQIRHLRTFVNIDPLNEEAHVKLVQLLARAGRRREAEKQRDLGLDVLADIEGFDRARLSSAVGTKPVKDSISGNGKMSDGSEPDESVQQEIRFCRAQDATRIAYAVTGTGKPLVKAANWMSHLEFDWESPIWRHWIHALSQDRQLVRYDERGNGMSDRQVDDLSFEAMVADLETVVDALELERFPLLGISQGCAVSVEYAYRHPERVSCLILYGGFVQGWRLSKNPDLISGREAMTTLMRTGWGQNNAAFRQVFTTRFMPEASSKQMLCFNDLQRKTVSPENASRFHESFGTIDVSERLPHIAQPALVLHAVDDAEIALANGREFALNMPTRALFHWIVATTFFSMVNPHFIAFSEKYRASWRFTIPESGTNVMNHPHLRWPILHHALALSLNDCSAWT
jgi:DNA-binding SARP family transcriptional activator/pimeloyl-ACP methyl ester carboxylesterase